MLLHNTRQQAQGKKKKSPTTVTESNRPKARMPIIPQEREIRQVFHFYSINIELRQKRGVCEVVTDRLKQRIVLVANSGKTHRRPCIFCRLCGSLLQFPWLYSTNDKSSSNIDWFLFHWIAFLRISSHFLWHLMKNKWHYMQVIMMITFEAW